MNLFCARQKFLDCVPALAAMSVVACVHHGVSPQTVAASSALCAAAAQNGDSTFPSAKRSLVPGTYRFQQVTTKDWQVGKVMTGTLKLWRTSRTDRSSENPKQRPAKGDTARYPFFGMLKLEAADSNFFPERWNGTVRISPAADSPDPLHPGVLVEHYGRGFHDALDPNPVWLILMVASTSNYRNADQPDMGDGGGEGLFVRQITPTGFAGTWGPWGSTDFGRGWFCADRVTDSR